MNMTCRCIALLLISYALAVPAAAWASDKTEDQRRSPAPPKHDERWYVVMMQDPQTGEYMQCGYMHAVTKTVDEKVHSTMSTKIEIRRGPVSVEIIQEQNYVETPSGEPLSFRMVSSLGNDPETVSGTIMKGKVTLVAEQYGREKERNDYDFDPKIRFPWGQLLVQQGHGLKKGTKYTLKSYEPAFRKDGPLEMESEVMGRGMQSVLDVERELTRIRSVLKLGGASIPGVPEGAALGIADIETDIWVDDDFTPVIMTMNLGMMQMKMFETSRDEAMRRGAPPEMFFESFVYTDRPLEKGASEVTLRVRLKEGAPGALPEFPTTPMQSIQRKGDREALVTIRRNDWARARGASNPDKFPEAVEALLNPSSVCDSNDSRIRRLARRAVRDLSAPAEKSDTLRKFVTDYITDKNMTVGFATASDVVRNRSGDCTEHAVLLAAMCRAAGIPARGVSGIVEVPAGYLGAEKSAFGYHMWTQVYIGDQWLDIDAALRQTDCDPNRIAMVIVPLGDEGLVSTVATLIPVLGRIGIDIVDVKK